MLENEKGICQYFSKTAFLRSTIAILLLKKVPERPKIRSERCGVSCINARKKGSGKPFRFASI
jgi:hypothetical protein